MKPWLLWDVRFGSPAPGPSGVSLAGAVAGPGERSPPPWPHGPRWMAEEASSSMSLQCLASGCCRRRPTGAPEALGEDGGAGGASVQLRGLDTKQLRGSLVVLYAPAGSSCLLRLVGQRTGAWGDGCSRNIEGFRSSSSGGRL